MAATGGSIVSVSLRGRTFSVTHDADAGRDLGGFMSETEMNGDGTGREILKRNAWSVEGLVLSIDDGNGDHEFLQDIVDTPGYVPCEIEYASGLVYNGRGKPTGELKYNNQSTSLSMGLAGTGKLTRQ